MSLKLQQRDGRDWKGLKVGWSVLLLLLSAFCFLPSAFSQTPGLNNPPFVGAANATVPSALAPLGIRFVTNFLSTADTTFYQTEEFTPSSNHLMVAAIEWTTTVALNNVTNTGTTNLVWWRAAFTNQSANRSVALYVTAMPQGTAPFAMRLATALSPTPTSMHMHIYEVTNANKTALWGSNAVAQVIAGQFSGSASARKLTPTNAPANPGVSMWFWAGAASCSCSYTGSDSPSVIASQASSSSPTVRFGTGYQLQIPVSFTGFWVTNSGYSGGANENQIGIEFKP